MRYLTDPQASLQKHGPVGSWDFIKALKQAKINPQLIADRRLWLTGRGKTVVKWANLKN